MSSQLVKLFAVAALAIGSIALAGPVAAECSGSHSTTASTSAPAPTTTASTATPGSGG